jgi:hypothetical protein
MHISSRPISIADHAVKVGKALLYVGPDLVRDLHVCPRDVVVHLYKYTSDPPKGCMSSFNFPNFCYIGAVFQRFLSLESNIPR